MEAKQVDFDRAGDTFWSEMDKKGSYFIGAKSSLDSITPRNTNAAKMVVDEFIVQNQSRIKDIMQAKKVFNRRNLSVD